MTVETSGVLTAKGAARREAILRAAEALILDEGYAAFSARGVAARAGIALSNVQYYFPVPTGMIAGLLRGYVDIYASAAIGTFKRSKGAPEERLAQTLRSLFAENGVSKKCAQFMAEVAGLGARDASVRAALEEYYAAYLVAARALIAELHPELNAKQISHRAPQLVALLEGAFLVSGPMPGPERQAFEPRQLASAIMRLLRD